MGHWEEFKIDSSEAWKYETILDSGADMKARVYIDDKGNISDQSYSVRYREKDDINDKPEKKDKNKSSKEKKSKEGKEKDGCLKKLLKAPFRLLWWLIKKVLVILSLGILSGVLNSDD